MEQDRQHMETYQQYPDESYAPRQGPGTPPVNVNVNLADILQGLGLREIIQDILDRALSIRESETPKVSKDKLLEAVNLGADPSDVLDLMIKLEELGALTWQSHH